MKTTGILTIILMFVLLSCNRSPAILKAEYDANVNMFYLTLREDGTYLITDTIYTYTIFGCGSKVYGKGNYLMKKNSIILDKNVSLGGISMSKNWHIRGDSIFFYTFFPDTKEIFENCYFIITERRK